MKGWQILKHSLRQVFGNLSGALRVSAVLYLAQIAVGLAMGAGIAWRGGMGPGMMDSGMLAGFALALAVAVLSSLWIAVSWHRFVLLDEEATLIPGFRGDRIWAYLLRSLAYAVILVMAGALWGMIVGAALGTFLMGNRIAWMMTMGLVVYLPVMVVGLRLTADLPAAALGADVAFLSGWRATAGHTQDIAVLVVLLLALSFGVTILGAFVFGLIPVVSMVWGLVIGWLQMMVGVSVVTTLYGHYIEKRDLV